MEPPKPTDESEDGLGQSQQTRVQQQTQAVGAMFKRQHVDHGEQEAGLWDGAETWTCRVLVGDGLQRNRLHTCGQKHRPTSQSWTMGVCGGPGEATDLHCTHPAP